MDYISEIHEVDCLAPLDEFFSNMCCSKSLACSKVGRREFNSHSVNLKGLPLVEIGRNEVADLSLSVEVFPVKSLELIANVRQDVVDSKIHLTLAIAVEDFPAKLVLPVFETVDTRLYLNLFS